MPGLTRGAPSRPLQGSKSFALLVGLTCCAAAWGDEVVMNNGDRLTGKVLSEDSEKIVLETEYAGTVSIARAQVRSLRIEPPDPGVAAAVSGAEEPATSLASASGSSGRVDFALSSDDGNTDKTEIDFDYEISYQWRNQRVTSLGVLELDTSQGEKLTDKWSAFNRYGYQFASHWYWTAWLAFKHDRFTDLRLRTLAGPGLGYRFAESDARNLILEAGPMGLRDNLYAQPDRESLGLGWSLNFDQLTWGGLLQPYHRQFGFVSAGGDDKRLWQSWTGVRLLLSPHVTSSLEFEYDYDSDPAVAAKSRDTTWRIKLGYKW